MQNLGANRVYYGELENRELIYSFETHQSVHTTFQLKSRINVKTASTNNLEQKTFL